MFEVKLYDDDGNEIQLKPGHLMVMGKKAFAQVPVDSYEADFVYRDPGGNETKMIAEFGSTDDVLFPSSDGTLKKWTDLNG